MNSLTRLAFCFGLLPAFSACSSSTFSNTGGLENVLAPPSSAGVKTESSRSTQAYLFAASNNRHDHRGYISVYALGSKTLVSQIIPPSVDVPNELLTDAAGNLYLADNRTRNAPSGGAVVEYAAGSSKVLHRITDGVHNPDRIALDASGTLYVANYTTNTVTVYGVGSKKILRTITDGVSHPSDLEFDSAGDLFVVNAPSNSRGSVTEYAPQSTNLIATITNGIQTPSSLAFDPSEKTMYVSNIGGKTVTVYDTSSLKLLRTITADFLYPERVAVDTSGNVYVLDNGYATYGAVLVFTSNGSTPIRTITKGMHFPSSMVFDASGNLYVGSLKKCNIYTGRCNKGSVSVYKRDEGHLWYQIKVGLDGVTSVAIGSQI